VSSPNPGFGAGLRGIVAIASNDIWATGGYAPSLSAIAQTLTIHWNGTSWSTVSSPNASAGNNGLLAVAAVSSSDIWAVGVSHDGTRYRTLIEHRTGGNWSIVPSPTLGNGDNALGGIVAL